MSYIVEYKFEIDENVFYYDQLLSGFGRGTIRQIEISVSIDNLVLSDNIEYVLQLANGGSTQVVESSLFTSLSPPVGPGPVPYTITTQFTPGDKAWLADDITDTISYVTVAQIEIIKYGTTTLLYYWVNEGTDDCTKTGSSIRTTADLLFETSSEALVYLGILPAPTPTPTPNLTPTPSALATINSSNLVIVNKINSDSITLYRGTPVYVKPDGTIARADNDDKALTFVGFVYDDILPVDSYGRIITEGTLVATLLEWDNVIVGPTLMAANELYYLSGLGTISSEPPLTGYVREVGIGLTDTEFNARIMPAYGL